MNRLYKGTKGTICLAVFFIFIFQSFSIFAAEPRNAPPVNFQEDGEAYFNSAHNQTAIQSDKSLSNLATTHTSIGKGPVLYGVAAKSDEAKSFTINSAHNQTAIQSDKSLSNLATTHTSIGEDLASYGFVAKSDEAKFFIIGTLYSEALAHLRSGNSSMAASRLEAVEKQFIVLQVPNSLYNYVSKTRNLIELKKYSIEALLDILSLFQPFFEDYAKGQNQDKLILFRAGSWLVDMSLTAAANNKQLIKQGKRQLVYFIKEMKRMDAPKGVLKSLEKIDRIATKDEIGEKDVERVIKQVKKIQTILG